jgi:ribosomal protein S2
MAKRSFRMGVKHTLTKINKIKKNNLLLNNQSFKKSFYTTLIFWGTYNVKTNVILNNCLLGKRYGFSILNAEHHVMMLKRATKFLFQLTKYGQKILFVNEPLNQNFDGIVKSLAVRALQPFIVGKWPKGVLVEKKMLQYSILFFNPNKSNFAVREANKIGIPLISLNSLDNEFLKSMYPIFCNNIQGDSIFFNSFILSNSIIESQLFNFIKKKHFSFKLKDDIV